MLRAGSIQSCQWIPIFWKDTGYVTCHIHILPTSLWPWKWRQRVHPKQWQPPIGPHSVTTQNTSTWINTGWKCYTIISQIHCTVLHVLWLVSQKQCIAQCISFAFHSVCRWYMCSTIWAQLLTTFLYSKACKNELSWQWWRCGRMYKTCINTSHIFFSETKNSKHPVCSAHQFSPPPPTQFYNPL